MSEVKRYLAFSGERDSEIYGWDQLVGSFGSIEEAKAALVDRKMIQGDWWQIVDTEDGEFQQGIIVMAPKRKFSLIVQEQIDFSQRDLGCSWDEHLERSPERRIPTSLAGVLELGMIVNINGMHTPERNGQFKVVGGSFEEGWQLERVEA
jgi:hypothetical protein